MAKPGTPVKPREPSNVSPFVLLDGLQRCTSSVGTGSESDQRSPAVAGDIERVVIINDDCVPSGGAACIALESARQLRRMGLRVTFLTGDAAPNRELMELGVDVIRLGGRHLLDGPRSAAALRGLYDSGTRAALSDWIAVNDTPRTIYHLHNWHKFLSPSIFGALRAVAARLVFSQHDFFLACPNGGYYRFPDETMCELKPLGVQCLTTACDKRSQAHKVWRMARHLVRRSMIDVQSTEATFLVVHEGMVALLERGGVPRGSIRVLRNPVTAWLNSRCQVERNTDVLFVGRLEKDKGLHVLAAAARRVRCHVRVIGDGPLRSEISKAYPEIEFLGQCTRAEIVEVARTARCVVAPTLARETFGLVAMEALTSGIPAIVSETAFMAQEIVARGIGLACRPGCTQSLADQLARLVRDDSLAAEMSRRAYALGGAMVSTPEDWCRALVEIYHAKGAFHAPSAAIRSGKRPAARHLARRNP